jgi:hypothetical protein
MAHPEKEDFTAAILLEKRLVANISSLRLKSATLQAEIVRQQQEIQQEKRRFAHICALLGLSIRIPHSGD